MDSIASFFTRKQVPKSSTSNKPAVQSESASTGPCLDDGRRPCDGRTETRYHLLAKQSVAGDLGGVGSVAYRSALAKELFPYKYGLPTSKDGLSVSTLKKSERNMDRNILKFTPSESLLLGQELLSRRRWYVDGIRPDDRHIRAAKCERRILADGSKVCHACRALDNDQRDRKSTRLNSSHSGESRMPSSA